MRTQDVVWHREERGKQAHDRMKEGRGDGSRKSSSEERGEKGYHCIGSNHREAETFQGGTCWSITRFSKTEPTAPIEMREIFYAFESF